TNVSGFPLTYRFTWEGGNRVTHIDVPLGEPQLTLWIHVTRDATVHSDGDPEEVVRELVDVDLRDRLAAEYPVTVSMTAGRLRLAKPQWIEAPGAVAHLAGLAADLAERIGEALVRVSARGAAEGSPYRGR
ncbi:MAG TPA: hypothetical protein VKE22_06890, partial [Haliangiales bacterium]|nr:hypothetical protein [Haliangiales bacterium]